MWIPLNVQGQTILKVKSILLLWMYLITVLAFPNTKSNWLDHMTTKCFITWCTVISFLHVLWSTGHNIVTLLCNLLTNMLPDPMTINHVTYTNKDSQPQLTKIRGMHWMPSCMIEMWHNRWWYSYHMTKKSLTILWAKWLFYACEKANIFINNTGKRIWHISLRILQFHNFHERLHKHGTPRKNKPFSAPYIKLALHVKDINLTGVT